MPSVWSPSDSPSAHILREHWRTSKTKRAFKAGESASKPPFPLVQAHGSFPLVSTHSLPSLPPSLPPSPPRSLHLSPPPSWQPRGCFIVTFAFISFSPKAIPLEVYPTPNHQLPNCCCCLVAKSRPTLCGPMDCNPPGSSVHGICQARILEWVAISFSRGSSQPKDRTHISCVSPALPVDPLPLSPQGSPSVTVIGKVLQHTLSDTQRECSWV